MKIIKFCQILFLVCLAMQVNAGGQYNIGVNVTGLAPNNSIFLNNNNIEAQTEFFNGMQVNFPPQDDGSTYDVTVSPNFAQPTTPNQTCIVLNGSGTIAGADVIVNVECTINQYNVGINVTGLGPTNTLGVNIISPFGSENLFFTTNNSINFSTKLDDETNFSIEIIGQTLIPNQSCIILNDIVVTNGNGTVAGVDVIVNVACTFNYYDIYVNVTGLHDQNTAVFLSNNNIEGFTGFFNGTNLKFPIQEDGSAYNVSISSRQDAQPTTPNQTCVVLNGSGIFAGADVTVNVECTTNQYNIGVSVSGLATSNSVELLNNGGDSLMVIDNGAFNFNTPLDDESSYDITVSSQPTSPNQTCIVNNGNSQLAGSNMLVTVVCTTNQYNINVNVTGLSTNNFTVLTNNSGDFLQVFADGDYTFATALFDESSYDVAVIIQPETPSQLCSISNGTGNLSGTDVMIQVTCAENEFMIGGVVSGLSSGNSLALSLNQGAELLKVHFNQPFVFLNPIVNGSSYDVSVFTNPTYPNQTCLVSNNSGEIIGADIIDIQVDCSINSYYIGGTVVGLISGNYMVLQNNISDALVLSQDGVFVFNAPILDLTGYDITIESQPNTPIQTCSVINGNSSVAGFDITNVIINCEFGDDLIYRHGFENTDE